MTRYWVRPVTPSADERAVELDDEDDPTAQVIQGEVRPASRRRPAMVEVIVDGWRFELEVEDEQRARLRSRATNDRADGAAHMLSELRAIIPGRVVSVAVSTGDRVSRAQPLLVVEAMKMQNDLRSPRDGVVARVSVAPGQTIELGDLLVVIEDG
jgi:biotin carboxyl carrier protein